MQCVDLQSKSLALLLVSNIWSQRSLKRFKEKVKAKIKEAMVPSKNVNIFPFKHWCSFLTPNYDSTSFRHDIMTNTLGIICACAKPVAQFNNQFNILDLLQYKIEFQIFMSNYILVIGMCTGKHICTRYYL